MNRAERRRAELSLRRERRRGERDEQAGADYGVVAGWCLDEEHKAEARKGTHDAVVDLLGPARNGGVSWIERAGAAAHELLDRLAAGEKDPVLVDHYRRLRAHLREYGGWIVVAMAPQRRP